VTPLKGTSSAKAGDARPAISIAPSAIGIVDFFSLSASVIGSYSVRVIGALGCV
jgi:hypothetical protein